jgi:hypothetical protein
MTIEAIAKAAAEEIGMDCVSSPADGYLFDHLRAESIIARHFAPLAEENKELRAAAASCIPLLNRASKELGKIAEQRDRLLELVKSVRKMHQVNELDGTPCTHCQCDVCSYLRAACEADGKGTP